MERKNLIRAATILVLAVVLGAFGAHALKARLAPGDLAVWKTGVEYQFYHGLGILLLAALGERVSNGAQRWVGRAFVLGVLLFSGSLYILSTKELTGLNGLAPILGPITPLGGLCFIAGWTVLLVTAWRRAPGQ